jgi:hypothetical protein
MKKLLFIFFFFIVFIKNASSQDIIPMALDSVSIKADKFFGFDGYKNYYFIKDNVVIKKSSTGTMQFQDLSLGEVTKVDILNPLKIIVFYENFNTIVVLDNQMNEVDRINLSERSRSIVITAVGVADQDKLWLFNSVDQKLALYDLKSKFYQEIGVPINGQINYYQTDYNYFQWISNYGQWLNCDRYGKIRIVCELDRADAYQIIGPNKIMILNGNALFVRDFITNKQTKIQIVEKSFRNFYYKDQILSIFTNEGNTNYKINLP